MGIATALAAAGWFVLSGGRLGGPGSETDPVQPARHRLSAQEAQGAFPGSRAAKDRAGKAGQEPGPPRAAGDTARTAGGANVPAGGPAASAVSYRNSFADLKQYEDRVKAAARTRAAKEGWEEELEPGRRHEHLLAIRNGRVYERMTCNLNAAISTAADRVRQTPPHNLDGSGIKAGLWDEAAVRPTHQEFDDRVTLKNGTSQSTHATHVAGTIAARGVRTDAQGMAPAALLDSYDWDYDYYEMQMAGMSSQGQAGRIQISNHSYGFKAGWVNGTWYGTWGERESDAFGMYDEYASIMDSVCFIKPYFLPVKAAGNDRNDPAPSAGGEFTYYDNGWQTKTYDPETDPLPDGWDQGGFDTIAYDATAKNILTVGSINDAVNGGERSPVAATMTAYSAWGPTDDGRIKPDIVANGQNLLSCSASHDTSYVTMLGTSMATPNAVGSAALLLDGYVRLFPGRNMLASSLKGLIIHTADDLGEPGPDYKFGWGLMNTLAAAEHLSTHHVRTNAWRLVEDSLNGGALTRVYSFTWNGNDPIKVTLCWTDPAGEEHQGLDDRTPVLRHDLDLRVIGPSGVTNFPFVLDVENPADPASRGDNDVDNVEQVLIDSPVEEGVYTALVTLEGSLLENKQVYSMLVSGSVVPPEITHEPLLNTTNTIGPYILEAVITSEQQLAPGSLLVAWRTSGAAVAAGTSPLVPVGNDLYRAEIPGQAQGTLIDYYIEAETTGGIAATFPAGAPDEKISFTVVESVLLVITGLPTKVPGVDPDYGVHNYAKGVSIAARANAYGPETDGVRSMCVGWTAFGSAPPEGAGNEVTFRIEHDTLLAWLWNTAYKLDQESSPPGALATSTWWLAESQAATIAAPPNMEANGTNLAFVGWYLGGNRLPAEGEAAANPAGGILMTAPAAATARYMPADSDADSDQLPDWWEVFYFGSTDALPYMDSDGDGFSNQMELRDNTDPRDAASTPAAPAIAHTPLPNRQSAPAPWQVSATVTDNDSVSEVLLQWTRNGGAWETRAMTAGTVPGTYTGAIPAPGVSGDSFSYRIVARDEAGLTSVNGTYPLNIAYAIGIVTPSELGIFQLPRYSGTQFEMAVSNAGHSALVWDMEIYDGGLWDDAETGTNGWTHGGRQDVWHISSRRAFSGTRSWYFGNETSGRYPDNADAWLISPPIYVGPGAVFSFRQWLGTEELKDPEHAWDGCLVEISTNAGASFVQIEPAGGYPYEMYGHSQSAYPDGTPVFAGTGGWELVEFPLADHAAHFVQLRLRFGSDGYVVNEGWFVDDLKVTPGGQSASWLAVSQTEGNLDHGGVNNLVMSLVTAEIAPSDTRVAVLRFSSNDPVQPRLDIALGLHNTTRMLLASISGNGSIHPAGPVYLELGETTNFVIQAEPYHHIGSILTNSGPVNVSAGLTYTNFFWREISFSGTGFIHAEIVPNRTSQGVPEPWLVAYGLTNTSPEIEASGDQDGDSMLTWQEYIAGTDPTNTSSSLRITRMEQVAAEEVMEWPSAPGRLYNLYSTTNLESEYGPFVTNLPATPPFNVFTNGGEAGTLRFYRIGVRLPD